MKTLQEVILDFGVNRFARSITDKQADRLHKQFFGRNPVEIGSLGIHSPYDHVKAILGAILSGKPYDERQRFRSYGYTDKQIKQIIF